MLSNKAKLPAEVDRAVQLTIGFWRAMANITLPDDVMGDIELPEVIIPDALGDGSDLFGTSSSKKQCKKKTKPSSSRGSSGAASAPTKPKANTKERTEAVEDYVSKATTLPGQPATQSDTSKYFLQAFAISSWSQFLCFLSPLEP